MAHFARIDEGLRDVPPYYDLRRHRHARPKSVEIVASELLELATARARNHEVRPWSCVPRWAQLGRVLLEGPGVARMAYRADLERLLADTRPLFPVHTLRPIHRVLQTLAHELGSALTFNQYYTDLTEVEGELSAAAQGLMCRRIPEWLAGASRSERAVARWCDSRIGGLRPVSTSANDSRTPAPTA